MPLTIATLIVAYVLSQFYRAFLAVLAPVLSHDLGVGPEALAGASGWWFLAFALAQIPVGLALDRVGPRITVTALMALAAAGAALFAMATTALQIDLAMVLIGIGCAPVLMAAYVIFARVYSPAMFGTLAGMMIAIGSLGNLAASAPLSWAAGLFGWRASMAGLAGLTLAVAVLVGLIVRDPPRIRAEGGSLFTLLKMRRFWPILIMMAACYAPAAGLRGLWAGPYMTQVFAADSTRIGWVTLIMGLAMVAGNFAYGPLERALGTRKWLNVAGNVLVVACLAALALAPATDWRLSTALLAGIGLFGASFPMVIAHGRAFLPPALVGRGVTLMNLFGIGMTGVMQMATGSLHKSLSPAFAYPGLFLAYAALVVAGLAVYVWSEDRSD